MLEHTVLVRHRLEEQFRDLEQQHETAVAGHVGLPGDRGDVLRRPVPRRWASTATCTARRSRRRSEKLNWIIGGINTVVLLVSSLFMVLAVHYAKLGRRTALVLLPGR